MTGLAFFVLVFCLCVHRPFSLLVFFWGNLQMAEQHQQLSDRRRFGLLRGDELRKDEEKTKRKMERQKKAARSSAGGACVSHPLIFCCIP
eukprot:COSAG04_NODE_2474_length_4061_cov_26.333173_2_plen_90_part_00